MADLVCVVAAVALLGTVLVPMLPQVRESSKQAVCGANLRGLGQGIKIYANDNRDWYPHHYFQKPPEQTEGGRDVAVQWEGTMGSNEFLKITEQTTDEKSPDRNHPSRSLFMLVITGNSAPQQFVCPSTHDAEDRLRNVDGGREVAAQPGVNRFDFRGYHCLSYGYQLPYGQKGRPRDGLDPRMPIMADKGPYYKSGGKGLSGSGTMRDARSQVKPPTKWGEDALDRKENAWRPYNSRNHKREGQNVLYEDSHVAFEKRPIVGVNNDNIYTLQADLTLAGGWIGLVPKREQPLGPLTNTDSFVVP
jgi:hypothetical protein